MRYTFALLAAVTISPALHAAEPAVRNLDVRGLKVGGTTTLAIDGDDLGKTPRLLLPFAAKQTLKAGSTDKRAVFDVALDDKIEPGYYHLRVVTDAGVSLPTLIAVDRLPQLPATAPIADLPVALHGTLAGSQTAEFKFPGKAKQRVMVEIEAARLGSKLRPIVHLYDAKKLQLAWGWGSPTLHGDCRLEATLPEDGVYTVALHDVEYAAAAPSHYRLRIGQWWFVDRVFPPFAARGQIPSLTLLGMKDSTQISVANSVGPEIMRLPWPTGNNWSGPRPFFSVSPFAEFVQQPATDKPQELPAGPLGLSGQLAKSFAEDRYRIAVTPLKKVRLEVFAERIGSPIDTALVVRDEKGTQLARAEDSPGTLDPVLEYAVPDKVTSIIVGVVDAQGRGGPNAIYRLVVEPQPSPPSFRLATPVQRLSLPTGGRMVVPVQIERRGYLGKIDLNLGLPAGVKAEGATIPEGADGTLVTLERSGPMEPMIAHWRGGEQWVFVKNHPLEKIQPWLATEIAMAPSDAKIEFALDWNKLPADTALVPGMKLALPVNVNRALDKTTVKLSLLTSQITPILNNQPDPNKALRQEKPVELPVKIATGEIVALVPGELSAPVYDVTVQAELLDPAKKVLATAFAPVRRMPVKMPIVVKLDGPSRIEAALDAKKGASVKLQGKIERLPGLKADVQLAFTGLPPGAKADAVTVKADASDFTINIAFPPNVPAGEIKGIKLSGSFAPEPKTPNVRVKSLDTEITLVLSATK